MKMTWLHMEFVLISIFGISQGKLSRTAAEPLLTLASLLWSAVRDNLNLNWLIQLRKGKPIKTGSFPVECPNWNSNLERTILLLRKAGSKESQKEAKWMKRDPRVLQQCATYHCLALIVAVIQYIRSNALDWLLGWIIYRTRATISRSRFEAVFVYKPYIRPKVTVHKWTSKSG